MSETQFTGALAESRLQRLRALLPSSRADLVVINPGPSLTYLTGLNFHLMERPVIVIVAGEGVPIIVLPEFETAKLAQTPLSLQPFVYGESPADWPKAFEAAAAAAGMGGRIVGVEPTRLRFLELHLLENAAPAAQFVAAEGLFADLRARKDTAEAAAMRQAVQIAQRALLATLPTIRPGLTERQVAAELIIQLFKAGSDPELPFAPIVSGGPNSANPHASPSDRPLQEGDLLVIDWGAAYQGYISDLTRTFAIGKVDPEFQRLAQIVAQANSAGRAAAGPEVPIQEVDRAARAVIESAGYGPYFTHRTGHGIGMEAHEDPYIRGDNPHLLQTGMTFTVEPGIYLPGRGGVRIEDNLLITIEGAECFSDLPRGLIQLGD